MSSPIRRDGRSEEITLLMHAIDSEEETGWHSISSKRINLQMGFREIDIKLFCAIYPLLGVNVESDDFVIRSKSN